jgi:hypothetical protein
VRFKALLLSLVLVVGGAVVAPVAVAASTAYTWIGGTGTPQGDNSSWTDPNNWSPTGVPGNGDSVSIAAPTKDDCFAHVDDMPAVQLADFALADREINGSLCQASISGSSLSVSGTFTWHGGQIETPTTLLTGSSGLISPTVDATSELDSSLTVNGTLALSGNIGGAVDRSVLMAAGVALTVAHGATMTTHNTNHFESLSCCVNPSKVIDDGTIIDADNLSFDYVELDQHGTLNVEGANAQTVSWAAPTTSTDGAHYTGGGTYRVSGASILDTITGRQHIDRGFHFVLGGGTEPFSNPAVPADGNETIGGRFTLTGGGNFDWLGGHIFGAATVATSGGVSIGGNAEPKYLSSDLHQHPSTLRITVPTTITGGTTKSPSYVNIDDGSTMTTAGRTTVNAAVRFYHGQVVNTGNMTIHATTKSPVYAEAAGFHNAGTLTLAAGAFLVDNDFVQTAGTTTIARGTRLRIVGSSSTVRIKAGTLSGSGTVEGPVALIGGTISPGGVSIGALTISGTYSQMKSATAVFDLATHSGDTLSVHGAVTIRGTIAVRNAYRPRAGQARTLLTSASSLRSMPSCQRSAGTATTGRSAHHWYARVSGRRLVTRWVVGRRTSC